MDGLLVIDKPEGPTSHDVVARLRRLLRESRIGHTGTLDPMATGVLPLVVGRATRLARFLTADVKRYEAVVQLGQATDTYDRLGEPIPLPASPTGLDAPRACGDAAAGDIAAATASATSAAASVTREAIEAALAQFRGEIVQTPPSYSAKKIGGVAAHRLARRGEAVTPAAVQVTVHALTLLAHDRDLARVTLDVVCSAGFYVRSLAHDLGAALGCGAHLTALRRTASGDWTLAEAVALDDCDRDPAIAHARVIPMSRLLSGFPTVVVTAEGERRVKHGQSLRPIDLTEGASGEGELFVRVTTAAGDLIALATPTQDGFLHPGLVLV
jgi:tRNA pseudouridine55 synthase